MSPLGLLAIAPLIIIALFVVNIPYLAVVYKIQHGHTPIPETHGEGSEPLSTRDYWLRCVIGAAFLAPLQVLQIGFYVTWPFILAALGLDGSVAAVVGGVVLPILFILLLTLHVWLFIRVFDLENIVKGFSFFFIYHGLPYVTLILLIVLTGGFAALMQ